MFDRLELQVDQGIDARIGLASTLHAAHTTAVLLGSGASSAAGIPTGWQVTLDLIERVARTQGLAVDDAFDPVQWWTATFGSEPRYDQLVHSLAPSDADRRLLLRRYFECDQRTGELASPTQAHRDLASLIFGGHIRVVVTTNFDRLLEHALADVGVNPQVLTSPAHVAGMTPLVHSPVTIVKLHGDYASGRLLNSPDELNSYAPPWRRLLTQILGEYGLLVVGWSAEYDRALAEEIRRTVGRRYAWYWATFRDQVSQEARVLVASRQANVINTHGCDELFADLRTQVEALERQATRRQAWVPTPPTNLIQHRPQAWAAMPLIVTRVALTLDHPNAESAGLLLTDVRSQLRISLNDSELTNALKRLAGSPAVSGLPGRVGQAQPAPSPTTWEHPPVGTEGLRNAPLEVFQSGSDATLRCGGDGLAGVSGVVSVALSGRLGVTTGALVSADIGISLAEGATVEDLARIQFAAANTLAEQVVSVLDPVLAAGTEVTRLEISWSCPSSYDNTNRPVPPAHAIKSDTLGPPSRTADPHGGYAELVQPPLTRSRLLAFVHRAWEAVAINAGYLEAQPRLRDMAAQLAEDDA